MNKLIVTSTLIATLALTLIVPNYNTVFGGGPRLDWDERYEDIPGAPECWVDGYDAGFANVFDDDRDGECKDKGDQYSASWKWGCIDSGLTEPECNGIKNNPEDIDHESLEEENRRNCYDDGFQDGENSNSFNDDRDHACSEYGSAYESGFKAGCESIEGNTDDSCELTIKGHKSYCPDNPDDPACTEFLHGASNKLPPETGPLCGQEPSYPGCFKNQDPEKYCLIRDDPAFCNLIGDICDADGFVNPEDAYCKAN